MSRPHPVDCTMMSVCVIVVCAIGNSSRATRSSSVLCMRALVWMYEL